MEPLGVPWHPIAVKCQDFASSVIYLGFLWDLQAHTISLPTKKCIKYLGKVWSFMADAKAKVSCKDVMLFTALYSTSLLFTGKAALHSLHSLPS